jgi:hypothetical protein
MFLSVRVFDEVPSGSPKHELTLELPAPRVTAREIIRRRVTAEVEAYNKSPAEFFNGLVQPVDAERTLNGYRLAARRPLSAEAQCDKALEAFQRNGFFMLVGDHQVETLDEEISFGETTDVTFVRRLPLVGG